MLIILGKIKMKVGHILIQQHMTNIFHQFLSLLIGLLTLFRMAFFRAANRGRVQNSRIIIRTNSLMYLVFFNDIHFFNDISFFTRHLTLMQYYNGSNYVENCTINSCNQEIYISCFILIQSECNECFYFLLININKQRLSKIFD